MNTSQANPVEYLKFRKVDENAIQMLVTGECYYSSPLHFNDPLDCSYSLENFPEDIVEDLSTILTDDKRIVLHDLQGILFKKRRHINNGVVSFCGRYSNDEAVNPLLSPDLWGHYADNHRGICIGFSPVNSYSNLDIKSALNPEKEGNNLKFNVPNTPSSYTLVSHIMSPPPSHDNLLSPQKNRVVKVSYKENFELPQPNWEIVRTNYSNVDKNEINNAEKFLNTILNLNNALDVKNIVSNKHHNWFTENEYRLFGFPDKSQAIGAAISSVTFGLEIKEDTKKYLMQLVARFYGVSSVEIYKIVLNNGVLRRVPLDMNEAMPSSHQSTVEIK
jgi:hypothetical protein